jgi:hypothetical protein
MSSEPMLMVPKGSSWRGTAGIDVTVVDVAATAVIDGVAARTGFGVREGGVGAVGIHAAVDAIINRTTGIRTDLPFRAFCSQKALSMKPRAGGKLDEISQVIASC